MTRQSLLLIVDGLCVDASIRRSTELVRGFELDSPVALSTSRTELYAAGGARRLKEKLRAPHRLKDAHPEATANGRIYGIWSAGRWYHPEGAGGLPDADGTTAWQWLHYNLLRAAPDEAMCFLWDVYPADGSLAA